MCRRQWKLEKINDETLLDVPMLLLLLLAVIEL
jgi:hypothetical protein